MLAANGGTTMTRQHTPPLLLTDGVGGALPLTPLSQQAGDGAVSEADIQALVHAHPGSLPIAEIDPTFVGAIPICRELNTSAGPIDNFLVTPSGLPVLVECKLWRNPEGRREVVGQILDYAKELSRWSSSDLQREVSIRLKQRDGNPMLDLVRAAHPDVDEMEFNDALTLNLRRGRFLLLIVGDGIRAGVEAIAEYLQAHAGLHFSLGLVEMPIYVLPDGSRLVVPRVLAKTAIVTRNVIAVPEGYVLEEAVGEEAAQRNTANSALNDERYQFWSEFLPNVHLDDPEQIVPKPGRLGYLSFMLPAPSGSSWLTVYRDRTRNRVGVFLSASRNSAGEYAMQTIASDWPTIRTELGSGAELSGDQERPRIEDYLQLSSLDDPAERERAFLWLANRTNDFVNVLRPRVRSAVADYAEKH